MRAHRCGKKLLRIGQHAPLYLQLLVFFLPDRRALDLVLLKTPQVGLAQARLFIALPDVPAGHRFPTTREMQPPPARC